ncbi:DUF998 domain-containing protein [Nocardiopsis nanhaiensis]
MRAVPSRIQIRISSVASEPASRLLAVSLRTCGLVAGPFIVGLMWIQSLTYPGFDVLRNPTSALVLGDLGWIQTTHFVVGGALSLVFAAALLPRLSGTAGSTVGAVFIGLWGVAFIGAGIFPADSLSGYPPGTPPVEEPTISGNLHALCALVAVAGLAVGHFVLSRRFAARGMGCLLCGQRSVLRGAVHVVACRNRPGGRAGRGGRAAAAYRGDHRFDVVDFASRSPDERLR